MPAKRAILSALTSRELRAGADRYALPVAGRGDKEQLADALARARKVRVTALLQELSRDRLKELCRAFDLDDSGRRKADLAARLAAPVPVAMQVRPAAPPAPAAAAGASRPPPDPTTGVAPARAADILSVAQLEQYLWAGQGGEFYTPRMVVKLIVELLAPAAGMRVCDPTAGSGGMLIECAHHLERQGGNPNDLTLHGQEKNLGTWAICKMNMLLHGLPDARIEKGDTIRDPKLVDEGELLRYDRVIANPPFSLDEWGREVAESDGHGRFRFGLPPKTKGDLAFVQHMVAVLNAAGRLGVVMPHGVLFRGGAEGKIRQGMLSEDLFEAVIGLAPNLFYGTGIPASVLVLNRAKPARARRRGAVHRRLRGVRGRDQPESPARPRPGAHRPDLPRLDRRGEVRAGGAGRRDRAQRLEPEHHPLRGHRGGRRTDRRGGRGAQAPRAGTGTRRRRSDHEPLPRRAGLRRLADQLVEQRTASALIVRVRSRPASPPEHASRASALTSRGCPAVNSHTA